MQNHSGPLTFIRVAHAPFKVPILFNRLDTYNIAAPESAESMSQSLDREAHREDDRLLTLNAAAFTVLLRAIVSMSLPLAARTSPSSHHLPHNRPLWLPALLYRLEGPAFADPLLASQFSTQALPPSASACPAATPPRRCTRTCPRRGAWGPSERGEPPTAPAIILPPSETDRGCFLAVVAGSEGKLTIYFTELAERVEYGICALECVSERTWTYLLAPVCKSHPIYTLTHWIQYKHHLYTHYTL